MSVATGTTGGKVKPNYLNNPKKLELVEWNLICTKGENRISAVKKPNLRFSVTDVTEQRVEHDCKRNVLWTSNPTKD